MKERWPRPLRQGDVLLIPVASIPEAATRLDRDGRTIVLAGVEGSGDAHVVAGSGAEIFELVGPKGLAETSRCFLRAEREVVLEHGGRPPLTVPPGAYEVVEQRVFSGRKWVPLSPPNGSAQGCSPAEAPPPSEEMQTRPETDPQWLIQAVYGRVPTRERVERAERLHRDECGTLWRLYCRYRCCASGPLREHDRMYVEVDDPATQLVYFLRVDPEAYGGLDTARAAIASTWRYPDGSLVFESPGRYVLAAET
jgi:hypothetical protein